MYDMDVVSRVCHVACLKKADFFIVACMIWMLYPEYVMLHFQKYAAFFIVACMIWMLYPEYVMLHFQKYAAFFIVACMIWMLYPEYVMLHIYKLFLHTPVSCDAVSSWAYGGTLRQETQRFSIWDPWPLITSSGIAPPSLKKSTKRKEEESRLAIAWKKSEGATPSQGCRLYLYDSIIWMIIYDM